MFFRSLVLSVAVGRREVVLCVRIEVRLVYGIKEYPYLAVAEFYAADKAVEKQLPVFGFREVKRGQRKEKVGAFVLVNRLAFSIAYPRNFRGEFVPLFF